MDLLRVETFQAPSAKALPDEKELTAKAEKMAADLDDLRTAPVAEPYDGPALLSGRAAAVFFHGSLGCSVGAVTSTPTHPSSTAPPQQEQEAGLKPGAILKPADDVAKQ